MMTVVLARLWRPDPRASEAQPWVVSGQPQAWVERERKLTGETKKGIYDEKDERPFAMGLLQNFSVKEDLGF